MANHFTLETEVPLENSGLRDCRNGIQSTRLSIRGVGAVDPVAPQRPLQQRPHERGRAYSVTVFREEVPHRLDE